LGSDRVAGAEFLRENAQRGDHGFREIRYASVAHAIPA
jgi:hypothetical protein